jgi:hypothetical protein
MAGTLRVNEIYSSTGSISLAPGQQLSLSESKTSLGLPRGTTSQEGTPVASGLRFDTDAGEIKSYGQSWNRFKNKVSRDYDNIVKAGLIYSIDFGNLDCYPESGLYFYDISKNKRKNELISGPTFFDRGFMRFDGVNDYSTTDVSGTVITNPDLNGRNLSFSFWAKVYTNNSYYMIASGGQTGSASGMAFSYQAGNPFVSIKGLSGGFFIQPIPEFPLNEWIHWTVTCDGSQMIVYKNSNVLTSVSSATQGAVAADNWQTLTLGRPNNALSYWANFDIMNLEFYDRALTPSEVVQNYQALLNRSALQV